MAYKDKDKQREANRRAQSRRRKALAGMTGPGMTKQGMTERNVTPLVLGMTQHIQDPRDADPKVMQKLEADIVTPTPNLPANFGQADCACRHCRANRANGSKLEINHGPYKGCKDLIKGEVNRVALPGDVDYIQSEESR
jgi:hypothetical protein